LNAASVVTRAARASAMNQGGTAMVNVFLNNGQEFQEVSIEAAASAKIVTDGSTELQGAVVLVCLDQQGREIARFKWSDVAGYAYGFAYG
jgi:hypothetical protein